MADPDIKTTIKKLSSVNFCLVTYETKEIPLHLPSIKMQYITCSLKNCCITVVEIYLYVVTLNFHACCCDER